MKKVSLVLVMDMEVPDEALVRPDGTLSLPSDGQVGVRTFAPTFTYTPVPRAGGRDTKTCSFATPEDLRKTLGVTVAITHQIAVHDPVVHVEGNITTIIPTEEILP